MKKETKAHPADALRRAQTSFKKSPTYETAVDLQRAKRNHRDYRASTLKLVKG